MGYGPIVPDKERISDKLLYFQAFKMLFFIYDNFISAR